MRHPRQGRAGSGPERGSAGAGGSEVHGRRHVGHRAIAVGLSRPAHGPHLPSGDHQRLPLGPDRQLAEPVAEGRRPEPHRHRLGRPDLRRLRLQLSLGAAHRSRPRPLADGPARTPAGVDRHPAGGDPGVSGGLERGGAGGEPRGRDRRRPGHRHRLRHPGHHHRRAAHRADGRGGGRVDGGGRGRRGGGLVDRVQARRGGRAGDGGRLSERGGRGVLAGHLSRARSPGRSLQHRPDVRTRAAGGVAYRRPGAGRGSRRLALRPLRPGPAAPSPGSPAPWPDR